MRDLLTRESLVMQKKSNKSKKGYTEVDLIPLIRGWNLEWQSDTMTLDAVLSAQNPGLNPELIRAAFCRSYPEYRPRLRHLPPPGGAGRRGKDISIKQSDALFPCVCRRAGRFVIATPKTPAPPPSPAGRSRGR